MFFRWMLLNLIWLLLRATSTSGEATVLGTVFCDQCHIGEPSIWGPPMHDASVTLDCQNSGNSDQAKTSFIGTFVFKVGGDADLSSCTARLTGSSSASCSLLGNAEKPLKLDWKIFGESFYSVAPLFYKPQKPMSFCPHSGPTPPLVLPKPPPLSLPPSPFQDPSSCSHDEWMKPEYRCYWKFASPNETVVEAFGPAAAHRYGTNTTLMDALNGGGGGGKLRGRSKAYRALLPEAVAALLNAYSSWKFKYAPWAVAAEFTEVVARNSPRGAAKLAEDFRTANSEHKCLLQACK